MIQYPRDALHLASDPTSKHRVDSLPTTPLSRVQNGITRLHQSTDGVSKIVAGDHTCWLTDHRLVRQSLGENTAWDPPGSYKVLFPQ